MTNFKGIEIDILEILKTSSSYETFYGACIDEGLTDSQIENFWENEKDYCGIKV